MASLEAGNLNTTDILGNVYEFLIKQFADDAGKKGGECYSLRRVVKTIVQQIGA